MNESRSKTIALWVIAGVISAFLCSVVFSETIAIRTMEPNSPTPINLSKDVVTVVKFPSVVTGVFGLGITIGKDKPGDIQVELAADPHEMVLHPLTPDANTFMTVVMDQSLWVFEIRTSANPDVALTLRAVAKSQKVTEAQIVDARPRFDIAHLCDLADRAGMATLAATAIPDSYNGYEERGCDYQSEDAGARTVVNRIQKFPLDDAIIITGTLTNLGARPLDFDASKARVAINRMTRPITWLSCNRPIAAKADASFKAIIVGGLDGSRADYSLNNEYRMLVNSPQSHKEGSKE